MSLVDKLETTVAGWLKSVPHLPTSYQKWIADNVWWLTIIGVIASVISIFMVIGAIMTYLTFPFGAPAGYYYTQFYATGWIVKSVLSLLFSVAATVLMAMAISPLQKFQRKGWSLLFLVLLVGVVSTVVGSAAELNPVGFIFGVIWGGIGAAIQAYLLFEVRSYFTAKSTKTATPPLTPAASK